MRRNAVIERFFWGVWFQTVAAEAGVAELLAPGGTTSCIATHLPPQLWQL